MSNPAYIVALTGGIGSGKSTVADLFAQHGAFIIDTDALAHSLTATGGRAIPAICKAFGNKAVDVTGALDRSRMRTLVFEDTEARNRLEKILHPMIREEVDTAIASRIAVAAPYVMLAVPLLFESMGYRRRVQRTIAVDCPVDLQRQRVHVRSALAVTEIDRILAAQLSRGLRLQLADDVVSNAGNVAALHPQVIHLHRRYLLLTSA